MGKVMHGGVRGEQILMGIEDLSFILRATPSLMKGFQH